MSDQTLKIEINLKMTKFLALSLLVHVALFFVFLQTKVENNEDGNSEHAPIIVTIGDKNSRSQNTVFVKPKMPSASPRAAHKPGPKMINLSDLSAAQNANTKFSAPKGDVTPQNKPLAKPLSVSKIDPTRPGQMPAQAPTAMTGVRYGSDDFKKMRKDPMFQGGGEILTTDRVALNFEVPEGKDADELNESQLKLYGFIRRGAMKYVNSISAEIKEFELKNPHLRFPLVDTKQVLTGRLVYDNEGNLKQIKMVRWSNNDKLQGFFENVLKRLENLQNPPKELWVEKGEFTVFVTLQING